MSDLPYNSYIKKKYFGHLDGLRFICIFMVLWHHYSPVEQAALQLFGRGFLGVDFFFVLSGFLITTLLLRETQKTGLFSLKHFYIRRFLRIVPVYYFVVTIVSAYYILLKGQTQYLDGILYYYLFLSNFLIEHTPLLGITWSLAVEEQYYLFWPLLMLLLPSKILILVCVILILLNVGAGLSLFNISPQQAGPLLFKMPNATYAPILMGSLSAVLLNHKGSFTFLYRITHHNYFALCCLLSLILIFQFGPESVIGFQNLIIHTLMTFCLIGLVVKENNLLTKFLKIRFVRRIGIVSYGIYLYHLIALDITNRSLLFFGVENSWVTFVAYCLLSYLMAEISFRTLEAYFQRFRPKKKSKEPRTA